jgi:hypothetical protein
VLAGAADAFMLRASMAAPDTVRRTSMASSALSNLLSGPKSMLGDLVVFAKGAKRPKCSLLGGLDRYFDPPQREWACREIHDFRNRNKKGRSHRTALLVLHIMGPISPLMGCGYERLLGSQLSSSVCDTLGELRAACDAAPPRNKPQHPTWSGARTRL